jgi:hypothetical protein
VITLWRMAAVAWYEWALREIDPMHEDVPYIVHRLNALRAQLPESLR